MQNRHLDIQIQCLIFYFLANFPKVFFTDFLFLLSLDFLPTEKYLPSCSHYGSQLAPKITLPLLTGCQLGAIYPLFFYTLFSHRKSKIQHIFCNLLFWLLFGYLRSSSSLFCTLKNSFFGKIVVYALQHNPCNLICKLLNLIL